MVAGALGALLTLGLVELLSSTKTAYIHEESISLMQETGRYALQVVADDVRATGSLGCRSADLVAYDERENLERGVVVKARALQPRAGGERPLSIAAPLAYDWGVVPASLPAGPKGIDENIDNYRVRGDFLVTWGVYGPGIPVDTADSGTVDVSAPIKLVYGYNDLRKGRLALVTDCIRADIFEITNESSTSLEHGSAENLDGNLSKDYNLPKQDSIPFGEIRPRVFPFRYRTYFVCCVDRTTRERTRTQTATKQCQSESEQYGPSLCVAEAGKNIQSLVMEVADLRVTLSGDQSGDGTVDFFAHADSPVHKPTWVSDLGAPDSSLPPAPWGRVSGLQLELLVGSTESTIRRSPLSPSESSWPPTAGDVTDRLGVGNPAMVASKRIYERYVATAAIRARTPWVLKP